MAWHVAAGDEVALNQVLVDVETEKAVVELPSPFAGTVVEVLAARGRDGRASVPRSSPSTPPARARTRRRRCPVLVGYGPSEAAAEPPPPQRAPAPRPGAGARPPPTGSRPLAAPPVRFMARQNGVDLADVTGHGPGGVITREDLAAHLAGTGGGGPPPAGSARSRVAVAGARRAEAHGRGHGPQRGDGAAGLRLPDARCHPDHGARRAPPRQPALRGRARDAARRRGPGRGARPARCSGAELVVGRGDRPRS